MQIETTYLGWIAMTFFFYRHQWAPKGETYSLWCEVCQHLLDGLAQSFCTDICGSLKMNVVARVTSSFFLRRQHEVDIYSSQWNIKTYLRGCHKSWHTYLWLSPHDELFWLYWSSELSRRGIFVCLIPTQRGSPKATNSLPGNRSLAVKGQRIKVPVHHTVFVFAL